MIERIELALELSDANEHLRNLRIIGSPVQEIRGVFDVMEKKTEHDWELIVARLGLVPQGLASFEASLETGLARGVMAARRQAVECAKQAHRWGGTENDERPFFLTLLDDFDAAGLKNRLLRDHLEQRARRATAAYAALGRYLADEYAPKAPVDDPVGPERYALLPARSPAPTSTCTRPTTGRGTSSAASSTRWHAVAERILPGEPIAAVIDHLETDPHRSIDGADHFRHWLQELIDSTIAELNGTHFDIAEPLQRCEAMIAPAGWRRGDVLHATLRGLLAGPAARGTRRSARPASRCGARCPSPTTKAYRAITSRSRRRSSCRDRLTRFQRHLACARDTSKGGRCTPNDSWASWATSRIPTTSSACSGPRPSARCA